MNDTYMHDIARAADYPRVTPAELRQLQREMWARHKVAAWQGAPLGTLSAGIVGRRARKESRSCA